uniref:Uncharacterized protein n=1 Tax=uncultured Thiotrichaceae bacterium TaxID=298394 RepID=A0A6S6UCU3_9GAMM|nr:MAG: Unknown protein [uncultured Thiotrichaceae bacterium]
MNDDEFVDIFYVGILPVRVPLAEAEDMIAATPFDGCRMVDMYDPYDKCFMLGMLNSTYSGGLYSAVILPALIRLFPECGTLYTRELAITKLITVRERGTYLEKMVIFNWLWAYAQESDNSLIQLSLSNWLLADGDSGNAQPALDSTYH